MHSPARQHRCRGDAFRHLVWAAELTRRFGPRTASIILDLHERIGYLGSGMGYLGNGWSKEAEDMDRHNNAIGVRMTELPISPPRTLKAILGKAVAAEVQAAAD